MTARHRGISARRRWRRIRHLCTTLVLVILVLGSAASTPSDAATGFTAKVTNSVDSVTTNPYFTCKAAAIGDGAYFSWPLSDSALTQTASDATGNGRTGAYVGLPTRSATKSCTRDTGGSVQLAGTALANQYVTASSVMASPPANFTLEVWFNTSTPGGKLFGWGTAQTGASGQYDRHIYMTDTGILYFGVYPSAVKTINSGNNGNATKGYADGKWHYVAASLSSTTGMALYVDGAQVATDTTTKTGESDTNGYWRVGYDSISSWTNQPTDFYFTGLMANASLYTKVLTPTQISQHYAAGL